jgi:glycerophosphoryl diester phosphodiesterase
MMQVPLPPAFWRIPVAHRALHDRSLGRIENAPASIRAAVTAGYAIEIDVQLSADGQAMVFHDEALGRLTGQDGWVKDMNGAALSQIALLGSSDTIPTLPQVLALIGGRVPLLIELKDPTQAMAPTGRRLEAAVAQALSGYQGDVAVMSFNPHCMVEMARVAPKIARGLTTSSYDPADWHPLAEIRCTQLRGIPDYDRVGASFISHQGDDLTRPRVADLKAAGAAILCWTIRSPMQEARVRQVAHNITFEGYLAPIPA